MSRYFRKPDFNSVRVLRMIAYTSRLVLFFVVSLFLILSPAWSDWTSFRGNPQLTGVADSDLPEKLDLLWAFKTEDIIESTAAIVDDVVYIGALDGYLYAIDAQSGKQIWKYQADGPIKSSPSINNGIIYFGDDEGVFHAVDISTRKMKWQYKAEGEIISSANFADNLVLFGSYDGFLYCLNKDNGDFLWKFETEGYIHGTPAIYGDFTIVTGCDSYLRIINIKDGKQTQQVNLGAYVGASPAILDTGTEVQKGSILHAYCGTYGNEVLGVDLNLGEIAWNYENPDRQLPFFASAAVTKNLVIIGGRDKMMHALSPETGEPIWTYATKSRIESSPVIVGKRVFFGTSRGMFIALDITSGDEVWSFETGSSIVASPSVANGKIYIGTEDGILYCFGKK